MPIVTRLRWLQCGLALLLAAGCAGQGEAPKIDPSVIRYQVAPVLQRGEALFPGGATVFFAPRSGTELLSGIARRTQESPRQTPGEILKKF